MEQVVKTKGQKEKFDERKVYASVYAACASAQWKEDKCEELADTITKKILVFIKGNDVIDSLEIRKKIRKELDSIDKELGFFYAEHLPNLKKL